jgi:hypothetical protein
MLKVLNPRIHGALDYLLAIVFLVAPSLFDFALMAAAWIVMPWLFGFAGDPAARNFFVAAGVGLLAVVALTDYRSSGARVFKGEERRRDDRPPAARARRRGSGLVSLARMARRVER